MFKFRNLGFIFFLLAILYSCDKNVISKKVDIDSEDLTFEKLVLKRDFNNLEYKYYWWLDCEVQNKSKIDSYSLWFDLVVLDKSRKEVEITSVNSPMIYRQSKSTFEAGFSTDKKVSDFRIENIVYKIFSETGVKMEGEPLPPGFKNLKDD